MIVRATRGSSLLLCLGLLLFVAAAVSPASAVCLATGKSCGVNSAANDRLCCPGMMCGWGNVCQPGCRINGTFYPSQVKNPGNACQSCQPNRSTTSWSSLPAGTACGSSSSTVCDRPDTCNGAGSCQSNFELATKVCRASVGECDIVEKCTGSSSVCPADVFATPPIHCTGASQGGLCDNDAADHCSGTASSCVDVYQASGFVCRAPAGSCDVAEVCDGLGAGCPPNPYAGAGTPCNDATPGYCDVCDGSGACQLNAASDGTACNDGDDVTTPTDICSSGSCVPCVPDPAAVPPDRFVDNLDGTVTDLKTCLVWERKTGTVGTGVFGSTPTTCPDPHVVNNRYQWSVTGAAADGGAFTAFLAKLNAGVGFAGHNDWRLPTSAGCCGIPTGPAELESILELGHGAPTIIPIFGPL